MTRIKNTETKPLFRKVHLQSLSLVSFSGISVWTLLFALNALCHFLCLFPFLGLCLFSLFLGLSLLRILENSENMDKVVKINYWYKCMDIDNISHTRLILDIIWYKYFCSLKPEMADNLEADNCSSGWKSGSLHYNIERIVHIMLKGMCHQKIDYY